MRQPLAKARNLVSRLGRAQSPRRDFEHQKKSAARESARSGRLARRVACAFRYPPHLNYHCLFCRALSSIIIDYVNLQCMRNMYCMVL